MTTRDRKTVTVEVISGVEGPCLALDDTRIAGPKPWGGGRVVHSFKVDIFHMLRALPKDIINDDR